MIKEQEKRLFERWRTERGYPSFIADGVFDEKTWTAEPLKLTFVLKEAHWRNGNVDLCEWVLDNTPGKPGTILPAGQRACWRAGTTLRISL